MGNNETGRNIELTSIAGKLRKQGLDERDIAERLMAAPERRGLPEREVRDIARSIAKKPPGEPRRDFSAERFATPLDEWAARRGFSIDALHAIGAVAGKGEVHFPMRDAGGKPLGYRRRRADNSAFPNGAKALSVAGQKNGLMAGPWPLPAGGVVIATEGEADACAALSAGAAAVVATPGGNPGRRVFEIAQHILPSRDVVLFPDPDPVGQLWMRKLGTALEAVGCTVRVVPPLEGDLDKRLSVEADKAAALADMIDSSIAFAAVLGDRETRRGELPVIIITENMEETNDHVIAALAKRGGIYQRGGHLVRVVTTREAARNTAAHIQVIEPAALAEMASASAKYVKFDGKTGKIAATSIQAILSRATWSGIPALRGVATTPTLRADGTVLFAAGFDKASGIFVDLPCSVADIPDEPDDADVAAAVTFFDELWCDFPFKTRAHFSAALAFVLTCFARYAFNGPSPLFLIDANTRGTGKSLLADSVWNIVAGVDMPRTTEPPDDTEMRKSITGAVLAGDQIVMLDNIAHPLGWASLDAALTGTVWRDRILGGNDMVNLPLEMTWCATGNNVQLAADTARRVLHIRLESNMETPEERVGFRHPDLRRWARENRGRGIAAALMILRRHALDRFPHHCCRPWGSFESWSMYVRHAVVSAGLPDPCQTREELVTGADADREAFAGFLKAFDVALGRSRRTAADIIECAGRNQRLGEALKEFCPARDGGMPSAKSLGRKLRTFRRRIVAGLAMDCSIFEGRREWFLAETSELGAESEAIANPELFDNQEGNL